MDSYNYRFIITLELPLKSRNTIDKQTRIREKPYSQPFDLKTLKGLMMVIF